jgi:Zn-dependent peptidase ImmA (M78 family)
MIEEQVGELEKREIRDRIDRILRDLGNPEPPLDLADARRLLSLDLRYYSSSEPGLVDELTHRFKLFAQKTIPDLGKHLATALAKSRLLAFWVPDSAKIMIDSDVPEPKHRWIEAHEITHSTTDWHKDFLLGDNRHTLDPACHATIEAEANFGAGRLLFLGDKFAAEARDLDFSFDTIKALSKRYQNSILSTLWRMVEDRNPSQPVFGMISVHPRYPEIGKHDGPMPWRYFIRSAAFRTQFSNVAPEQAFELITLYASRRRKGPIFEAQDVLPDVIGNHWEFQLESFSTTHALLTVGVALKQRPLVSPPTSAI